MLMSSSWSCQIRNNLLKMLMQIKASVWNKKAELIGGIWTVDLLDVL